MVVVGWNSFWCRKFDAAATKVTGATLMFACLSAFLSLAFSTLEIAGKSFRAGGYAGDFLARELSEYLNRTGSLIVVVTLIALSSGIIGRRVIVLSLAFGPFSTRGVAVTQQRRGNVRCHRPAAQANLG